MNSENQLNAVRKSLAVFLFLVLNNVLWSQQDTLYFTATWRPAIKDSAAFYRPPVKQEGNLFRVQDYYISGQLQMNALSKNAEKDIWQGTVTWYNEDGSVFQQASYDDNLLQGDFITYMKGEKLVATYENNRFKSGKRNIPYGSGQLYFEQEGDTLFEIIYEKDIDGICEEHYSTKDSYRVRSKYYGTNGIFIGERKLLPNGYYKGVEVFYYTNPMRVRTVNYYPFGQLLISETYHENGQIREEVNQEPLWSTTYYSSNGESIGKLTYRLEKNRLIPLDGTRIFLTQDKKSKTDIVQSKTSYKNSAIIREELYHENGQLSGETTYSDGSRELQVSYDEKGKEIARMIYKDYRPFDGTEMERGRQATYKAGELVEEIGYYPSTQLPQVKKTKVLETYYDKEGNVLGELKLKEKNGYTSPFEGKRISVDYREGHISNIQEYKDGVLVKQTYFRKRLVGKDTTKNFKTIEEYSADGYKKVKETRFYSNGNKQSETTFKNYKEVLGKFYDKNAQLIGSYDYDHKNGTRYVFFADSDQLKVMEEMKLGVRQRFKRYNYGDNTEYGQINPVLEEDIDINCCATFYTKEGAVIAKLTFKNQLPWEGIAYDHATKTKYTIKEGKRNGVYQKLDYKQNVLEEGQFKNDKEEGAFKYYDNQGILKRVQNFENGKLNGKSTYYDKDGVLTAEMEYANDLPMNGTEILEIYYGEQPNRKTYKDGLITEFVSYEKKGKSVTVYQNAKASKTTVYYKDSDKKQLIYGLINGNIEGDVIRYNKDGKEQYRALFKGGRMVSGTAQLTSRYQDNDIAYMEVTKDTDTLKVNFVDYENKVVLTAEEVLKPGSAGVYLNKLDVDLDYLTARRLY